MIKLMVCGSRNITDYELVKSSIENYLKELNKSDVIIIEGEARGVDLLAKKWAISYGTEVLKYPAKWDLYGKSAGFKRNVDMVKACDACLIIWDGKSKGTKHDIDLCQNLGKKHKVINV